MDYEKLYKEALERAKEVIADCGDNQGRIKMIESIFSELKESEDERIRKRLVKIAETWKDGGYACGNSDEIDDILEWLEKQGKPKMNIVQWKGDNLREVLEFTGKDKNFDKWFTSFEEYEEYVHEHNDIFKLFNEDGSHYEVYVGAWIVKTPDGYNVPSKAKYKQKIEQKPSWSEEDENILEDAITAVDLMLTSEFQKTHPNLYKSFEVSKRWLKSLKDRVQPQPKQEWSEEDENGFNDSLWAVQQASTIAKDENEIGNLWYAEKWLKEIKERMKGETL